MDEAAGSVEGTAAKHTTSDHTDASAISTETREVESAGPTVTADLSQMDFSQFHSTSASNKTDQNHPGKGRGRGRMSDKVSWGKLSRSQSDHVIFETAWQKLIYGSFCTVCRCWKQQLMFQK